MSEPERSRDEAPGALPPEPASQDMPPEEAAPGEAAPEEAAPEEAAPEEPLAGPPRRLYRVRSMLARIPHPPWRSRRGVLVLFLLFAGFGAAAAASLVSVLEYTETSSFCGRCHTMDPELKAYALSPHRNVTCAECHVERGLRGTVKAKINGTKQLIEVLTGTFPKPIPPPSHSQLPPVTGSCLHCHSLDRITRNDGPVKLVLRPRYQPDEQNTRELVAVALRPSGPSGGRDLVGVHWHIEQTVTYHSADPAGKTMDLVEINRPDGTVEQYIASSAVAVSADVRADVIRIKNGGGYSRVMDCLDCHNRTGHGVPSIDQAVDEAIAAGRISADLPYVKRDAVALLGADYPTLAAADWAINRLGASYQGEYPLIVSGKSVEIAAAVRELKRIYRLVATPDMKVQARTYADNLGHQSSPGCFRCHDGVHYQLVDGELTDKVIPSTCSTCHTFPQIGGTVTSIMIGGAPQTHQDELYVFNHKKLVSGVDPSLSGCVACHPRAYCENCHRSALVTVKHDAMRYNHPASVRVSGGQACAYCHQPNYCAQCHRDPVLETPRAPPVGNPGPGPPVASPG